MADIIDTSLMDIKPADLKSNKAAVPKPTKFEEQAIARAQGGILFAGELTGTPEADSATQAGEMRKRVLSDKTVIRRHFDSLTPETELEGLTENAKALQEVQQGQKDFAAGVTSLDQIGAAFSEMTAIPKLLRLLDKPEFEADPGFDYMAIRDTVEAGLNEEDRKFLREASSQAELDWKLQEVQGKQARLKELGAHGQGMAIAAGLTGGLLDPAGWAMGLGVGKAAQLANVGSRAALASGQTGRAITYAAGEGAVGNVLYEGTLDAAGSHVTSADYAFAAAFGAVFGQLNHIGVRREGPLDAIDDVIKQQGDEIMAAAQAQNRELYSEAQTRVGEDATPDQIKAEVDTIQRERYDDVMRIAFADVPESDQILPRYNPFDGESLPDALAAPEVRKALAEKWGITANQVEDAAERTILSEIVYRAERFAAANPVDEARVDSILAKAPWLASTGLNLMRSQNPVARYVASTLLESTTGAGGRRRTAAITKALRERVYMQDLEGFEDAYKAYRGTHGGSMLGDALDAKVRHKFDREVARFRENRRLGVDDEAHPAVVQAADHLDNGYNRMRLEQQKAGTIGAERLGDTSAGYAPRQLSLSWIKGASNEELNALSGVLARQLEGQWGDAKFAKKIAARYLDRARQSASGDVIPANLTSSEGGEILRDVLMKADEGLSEADIEKLLGRFSRGGAGHTKARLDLDMNEKVSTVDGKEFRVMDAFQNDQAALYQRYARRVSGDVALTQYGVMGDHGMRMLHRAMQFGPKGQRASVDELEAFEQVYAEFFGRPMKGTGNKHLDNLRMLTSSSRLGGMAFPQVAEMANSIGLLGVKGALKYVGQLPRLISDVINNKNNPLLESIELIGGPIGQDRKVIFPYQEANDTRVYGRDSLSAVDRIIRGGSNALPWLNGWHHLHAAQVRGIAEQIVHKSMRYIRDGGDDVAIKGMGITDDVAAQLKDDLARIAQFDDAGNLIKLDLTAGKNSEALNAYVQAVHRGSKQIIQGTFIGETGKWAHKDMLRLLTQFRTFSITSMEKQWTRQRVDYGTAKAFGMLVGAMSFALPIHVARVQVASAGRSDRDEYLETQLNPQMLARATLNYASLSGGLGDILDTGAALAGYEMSGVRGGMRSLTDNLPAAGYLNTLGRGVTERDPKDLLRSLPGGNIPWLVPVVNAASE